MTNSSDQPRNRQSRHFTLFSFRSLLFLLIYVSSVGLFSFSLVHVFPDSLVFKTDTDRTKLASSSISHLHMNSLIHLSQQLMLLSFFAFPLVSLSGPASSLGRACAY